MKKIKFTAKGKMTSYTGSVRFTDGMVKEVADSEAERLLADFPHLFSEVKEAKPEKSYRAAKDKSMKASKDK